MNVIDYLADENDLLYPQRKAESILEWFDGGIFLRDNLDRLINTFDDDETAVDALLFSRYGSAEAVDKLAEEEVALFKDTLLPRVASLRDGFADLRSLTSRIKTAPRKKICLVSPD